MEIMGSGSLLFFSLFKILQWGIRFYNYFFPRVYFCVAKWNLWRRRIGNEKVAETYPLEKLSDGEICLEDMKIVMARLGMASEESDADHEHDDDADDWKIGVTEFSEIMLDEEPSLAEIKQVFEVFDENKDGFIDATEVQRVLCGLCLKEGSDVEQCRRMICAFDDNGDGLLDFQEFFAFMDKCLTC